MKMWEWFFKKSVNFLVLLTQFCDKNLMNGNVSILWGKCISDVYFLSGTCTALSGRSRTTASQYRASETTPITIYKMISPMYMSSSECASATCFIQMWWHNCPSTRRFQTLTRRILSLPGRPVERSWFALRAPRVGYLSPSFITATRRLWQRQSSAVAS